MAQRIYRLLKNLLVGFGITLTLLFSLEIFLRFLPESILSKKLTAVPLIAPADRGTILLQTNGYRGKRPCTTCPEKNLRIVTMGGSSTFGIPMYYSAKTYSAFLQRLFDASACGQHVEVLNGGVAGFGIWQIVEALENSVLEDKPDIVMVSSWFNDSASIPGWYGFQGSSDHEGYLEAKRLRAIEKNPIYRIISKSRLYGLLRTLIVTIRSSHNPSITGKKKQKQKKKRSTPEEFKLGLERFVELSKQYNFLPVFLLEPLNRTSSREAAIKRNRYYQVIEEMGAAQNIPIIDTLTPLAEHGEEWLFYDFIHPNEHGHEIIAQAIYQSFANPKWHTQQSSKLLSQVCEVDRL